MNTIYYNICSKSLKGSSRELALFTLNISKTQIHVTIEHSQKSESIKRKTKLNVETETHTQQLTEAI